MSLDKTERDLAASARSQNVMLEAKRFAVVAGQRRAITFTEIPLGDAGIIGTAMDVTDVAAAEARLQQHVDAHADTLDKLQTAVAIFGKDQKLTFYNRAFVKLWGFPEAWLDRHPSDGEILDRLREMRKLPEQRDYQAWKRQRLALYQARRRPRHRKSSGTFPAARPCGWWPSRIPLAASASSMKTSPKSWRWNPATTR